MSIDRDAARRAVADFLRALGHDPSASPDLEKTPERVVSAFADELLSGYAVDLDALLRDGAAESPASVPGVVALKGIAVSTMCPHHLLPALGEAEVAYVPGTTVLGLGTIARLVDAFARRLTLQEVIGQEVVTTLMSRAGARGAYCRIELQHGCVRARGACQASARAVTIASAGSLEGQAGLGLLTLALRDAPRVSSGR